MTQGLDEVRIAVKRNGHASMLVSDYIINQHGCRFTQFQLIKLVFISHGRALAALGQPLIHDRIEAWQYGPVIPVLYHELKMYGDKIIPMLHYCGTLPNDKDRRDFFEIVLSDQERAIIDGVVQDYGDWSFGDLQRLCHTPGSPWDTHYDGNRGVEIPDSTIRAYYRNEIVD